MTVHDADVGGWGIAYASFRILVAVAVAGAVFARVRGIFDEMAIAQTRSAVGAVLLLVAGWVASYFMAVVVRADDEVVGNCEVPLSLLLDQGSHHLLLHLQKPEEGNGAQISENGKNGAKATTNSTGGLGVLRVTLSLSEH